MDRKLLFPKTIPDCQFTGFQLLNPSSTVPQAKQDTKRSPIPGCLAPSGPTLFPAPLLPHPPEALGERAQPHSSHRFLPVLCLFHFTAVSTHHP